MPATLPAAFLGVVVGVVLGFGVVEAELEVELLPEVGWLDVVELGAADEEALVVKVEAEVDELALVLVLEAAADELLLLLLLSLPELWPLILMLCARTAAVAVGVLAGIGGALTAHVVLDGDGLVVAEEGACQEKSVTPPAHWMVPSGVDWALPATQVPSLICMGVWG